MFYMNNLFDTMASSGLKLIKKKYAKMIVAERVSLTEPIPTLYALHSIKTNDNKTLWETIFDSYFQKILFLYEMYNNKCNTY